MFNQKINESLDISKGSQNKMFLNRFHKQIMSSKDFNGSYNKKSVTFKCTRDLYCMTLEFDLILTPKRIYNEETGENLYIMCEYEANVKKESIVHQWANSDMQDASDPALNIVYISVINNDEGIRKDFFNDTLTMEDYKNLTPDDIRKSVAYKKVKDYVNELCSAPIPCQMHPDLLKRIKSRNNCVPVAWLNYKSNVLNYLGKKNYNDSVLPASTIFKVDLSDMRNGTLRFIDNWPYYTNWSKWVVIKEKDIPKCEKIFVY